MDVFTCYTTSKIAIKVVQYPTYSVNACFKHEFTICASWKSSCSEQ